MPFVVADRVRETTTTTGTGTITLSGTAPTGFQTFGTAIGNGNNTFYTIAGGSEWEVGIGTYTAAGTTLSRDTVLSSSAGGTTKVTFSAGTKDVFVDYPAGKSVYQDGTIATALGTAAAPSYSFTGDSNTGMFSPAADTIAFTEGGAESMRINSSGNVGIGTNSPVARLHLFDTLAPEARLQIGTTTSQGAYTFYSSTINEAGVGFTPNTAIMSIYSGRSAAWGGQITFTTDTSERMRITQTGNVGIGNTSPGTPLDVTGTTRSGNFRVNSGGSVAGSGVWGTDTVLAFNTNSNERMRIDTSGNVGVGTSAPNAQLHVSFSPGASIPALGSGVGALALGPAANYGMLFGTISSGTGYIQQQRFDATSTVYPIALQPNGGSVGIGTASPAERLQVLGSIRVNATGTVFSNTYSAGNTQTWLVNNASSSDTYITSDTAMRYRQLTGIGHQWETAASGTAGATVTWTERMRLDSAGNLLVGTTTTQGRVSVASATGNVGFNTGTSASPERGNLWYDTDGTGWKFNIGKRQSGTFTSQVTIQDNDSVGVGTTSPNYKLEVRTDAASGFNWVGSFNNTATGGFGAGFLARSSVGSAYFYMRGDGLAYVENSTNNGLGFATNAIERMRITAAGDVGVGIVSPSTRIHAYNNTANTPVIVRTQQASTGNNFDYASFSVSATGASGGLVAWATGSLRAGQVWVQSDGAQPLVLGTNDTERMRVTSTGSVGVGTTAPQSRFHVSGGYITAGDVSSTGGAKIIGGDYSGSDHITTFGSEFSSGGPVVGYGVWPSTSAALAFVSSAAPALQRAAYTQSGNNHVWFTGASQTVAVGSAVTMTERMRIDGSGNLGLGTAPSGVRLDVNGSIRTTVGSGGTLSLFETDATRANQLFSGADSSGSFINATFSTGGSAILRIQTANVERMRVTAAGDIGIGTSSPASRFAVAGTTALTWAASGTSSGLVTIGDQGASGSSLFINTPSLNSSFASGLGVDGSYTNPGGVGTSIVNIKAFGVNSGGGYASDLAFHTAVGSTLSEKFRITSTGAITSSNLADAVGYKGLPQNSQTASYTLALSDMGKHISITTGGVVIPANGSVAFPIGSAVTIFNNSGSNQTISITTDTLRQAGTANTGSRTLAQYGVATVLKVTSTVWVISGAGVS